MHAFYSSRKYCMIFSRKIFLPGLLAASSTNAHQQERTYSSKTNQTESKWKTYAAGLAFGAAGYGLWVKI